MAYYIYPHKYGHVTWQDGVKEALTEVGWDNFETCDDEHEFTYSNMDEYSNINNRIQEFSSITSKASLSKILKKCPFYPMTIVIDSEGKPKVELLCGKIDTKFDKDDSWLLKMNKNGNKKEIMIVKNDTNYGELIKNHESDCLWVMQRCITSLATHENRKIMIRQPFLVSKIDGTVTTYKHEEYKILYAKDEYKGTRECVLMEEINNVVTNTDWEYNDKILPSLNHVMKDISKRIIENIKSEEDDAYSLFTVDIIFGEKMYPWVLEVNDHCTNMSKCVIKDLVHAVILPCAGKETKYEHKWEVLDSKVMD